MQFTKSTDGYLPHFKTRVLHYFDSCNVNGKVKTPTITIANVAKKFAVHPNTLSDWLNERKRHNKSRAVGKTSAIAIAAPEVPFHLVDFESKIIKFLQTLREELENDLEQFAETNEEDDDDDDSSSNINQGSGSASGYVLKFSTSFIADKVLEYFHDALQLVETDARARESLLSSWMASWCKRIYESHYNENTGNAARSGSDIANLIPKCKLIKYSEEFKREIARFANLLGQRRTSRMFEISQRQIYDWFKLLQDLESGVVKCPTPRKSNEISKSSTSQVLNFAIEQAVFDWVNSQLPRKCTSREIREKALELYSAQGFTTIKCSYGWYQRWCGRFKISHNPHEQTDPLVISWFLEELDNNEVITYPRLQKSAKTLLQHQIPSFKASLHWAYRFVKRNHEILDPNNHYSGLLPPALEEQAKLCLATINSVILNGKFDANKIGTMDEIPLSFSSPLRPEDSKSWKPSIKNCEATLIIGVLINGNLLPPFVIVKGQKYDQFEKLCTKSNTPQVQILYSKTSAPTISSLTKWLDLVWPDNSLLLWDSYDLHLEETELKSKCDEKSIQTILFPKGTNIKLQPINLSVKGRILTHIYNQWRKYHAQLMDTSQNNSLIIVPSADKIVEWVSEAYVELNQCKDQISNSFKECVGINI